MYSAKASSTKTSSKSLPSELRNSSDNFSLPLELCWTFGHESRVEVHNLSSVERKCIFFVSGTVGVLYDWIENKQLLFQSHRNNITHVASSDDKKWVATVDKGSGSCLIIWNSYTGLPKRIVNDLFEGGVAFMQFIPDSFLVLNSNTPQCVYIWNWKVDSKMPQAIYQFPTDFELQHHAAIHPECCNHFFTCGQKKVAFFELVKGKVISHVPPLKQQEFLKPTGDFLQATYVINSQLALTSTMFGNVLVWGNVKAVGKHISDSVFVDPKDRFPLRLIQPHEEKEPILVLRLSDFWIVSGNSLGHLYFWDVNLEVVHCYKDFNFGSLRHVCFTYDPDLSTKMSIVSDIPTNDAKRFQCRDFVVSTAKGYCGYFSVEENKMTTILYERDFFIRALAVNPLVPHVCFGDYDGHLQTWNYETKKLVKTQCIKDVSREIECIAYDPTGRNLACGLTCGSVLIFDNDDIAEVPKFCFDVCSVKVTMCKFSPDSKHLTVVDESYAIALFRLYCILPTLSILKKAVTEAKESWSFVAKERQHYRAIVDLLYNNPTGEEHLFLYTLGEDRKLVIYDVTECFQDSMSVVTVLSIEQAAIPTCMSWYPFFGQKSFLAIANNEYKIKVHDVRNQKCVKLNLLPIYDSPIRRMFITSECTGKSKEELKYVVFRTDHHIGLLKLPVDGNPYNALAIKTHILGIKDVVKEPSDKWLFSCGTEDRWLHMWKINTRAVLLSASDGGEGIEPFLDLLPNNDPQLIKDEIMNTVFALQLQRIEHKYPAQITLKQEILVDELDYIMAALGYYPSKYEFSILMEDAKFSLLQSTGEVGNIIQLEEVIKLFVNHRPVMPVTVDDLAHAFKTAYGLKDDDSVVPRAVFVKSLEEFGECIPHEEFVKMVTILCDHSPPSTDMDELFVTYCQDDQYYAGDEEEKLDDTDHRSRPAEEKLDWGDLDDIDFVPNDDDDSVSESEPQSSDEEERTEMETTLPTVTGTKDLTALLPERLSKLTVICDLLGFEYAPGKRD